jgi:hypothetical protein
MRTRNRLKVRSATNTRQRLVFRTAVLLISFVAIVSGGIVFLLSLSDSKEAYAATCSSTYTLDWSNPTTFTVTCGTVNAAQWTVRNDSCNYYSPVNFVDGLPGDPPRTTAIDVRVGQSGNLTNNDYAWIFIYVNGAVYSTFQCRGDTLGGVFYVSQNITVPAAGSYQVRVAAKNDKTTEFWMIKNGEVTACVSSPPSPLPVSLTSFTGTVTTEGTKIKWTTATEVNNDHFIVSRSSDAMNYEEIGRMEGFGTSSTRHDYLFTDDQVPDGMSYYKLSQFDYDGTRKDYGPIAVRKKSVSPRDNISIVYPNPFSDRFTYRIQSEYSGPAYLYIWDQKGTVLDRVLVKMNEGNNNIEYMPNEVLPPGMYLVGINTGDKIFGVTKAIRK